MEFKVGDVVVSKITGQYLNVLEVTNDVRVRYGQETKENGTVYNEFTFQKEELESVEDHLRRELKEMELRQALLAEAQKRVEQKKLDELPAPKTTNSSVN